MFKEINEVVEVTEELPAEIGEDIINELPKEIKK